MSKSYAFDLGQRVNVPGMLNVQGAVTLPTCAVDFRLSPGYRAEIYAHVFMLAWTDDSGSRRTDWFPDTDIIAANLPPRAEPVTATAGGSVDSGAKSISNPRARSSRAKTIGSRASARKKKNGRGVRNNKNNKRK